MTVLCGWPTRRRIRHAMRSEEYRWLLVGVLLTMLATVRAAYPTERDIYWSARAGVENMQGTPLARPDSWSWAADGTWYPNSPAWNVVLGLGWQSLEFWGLFFVAFLSISAFFALVVIMARAAGARALPTLVVSMPILLASSAALSGRATVVVQALVLGAALFAWKFAEFARRAHGVVAALSAFTAGLLISIVGNWVHLSFMLMAAVVALLWAITWWIHPNLTNPRRIALTIAGTAGLFAGCLLSPYGIADTLQRSRIVSEACQGIILEWTSLLEAARLGEWRWLFVGVVAVVAASTTAFVTYRVWRKSGRTDPRVRLVVPLTAVAIPFAIVGVGAIRFLAVGMLLLLPAAAFAATHLVEWVRRRQLRASAPVSKRLLEYTTGRFWTVIATGIAIVLLPASALVFLRGGEPAEAHLARQLPVDCRLFSDAGSAGPTLLLRPDIEVWIDGRADFYGRDHLIEASEIYGAVRPIPDGADCVILPMEAAPGVAMPLAGTLDSSPDWERVAVKEGFVLWVRS